MKTIKELQDAFKAGMILQIGKEASFSPTGEVQSFLISVYKLNADQPWCFKCAGPVTARTAPVIGAYLAGLDEIAGDYDGGAKLREQYDSALKRA